LPCARADPRLARWQGPFSGATHAVAEELPWLMRF
jgi:hypothetical protein